MRLHRLEVTAFGPYADTQVVDFDELNAAGVFLLTGPTGAGKTSILDAVCYALYAVVPGDREVRGLRSDHAPPDRAPRVELELTLGGRRLRVVRSPEWHRPKRRGTGTTKENASARLFVLEPDGTERLVSDRAQEVGHELGLVLGMSSEQFMQVVLLPQSGFQTFLKARSDDRREVLERLFATQRFSRIEEWMHDRARVVRERAQESHGVVQTLVALLADRSGTTPPDDGADGDAAAALAFWSEEVVRAAADRVGALDLEVATSHVRAVACDELAADTRRLVALAQRRDRALAERERLAQDAPAAADRATALDADRRAQQVRPLLTPLDRCSARAEAVAQEETRARAALERAAAGETIEAAVLRERLDELRALRPRAAELARATAEVAEVERALSEAEELRDRLVAERDAVPLRRAELERRLTEVVQRSARLADAEQAVAEATDRLDAARVHARLVGSLAAAESDERAAHEHANATRSASLDLLARRLDGIAAELAGALVDGEACQVCGSVEHPSPAEPVHGAVTEGDHQEAADLAESARVAHEEARRAVADLQIEVTTVQVAAGGLDVDRAERAVGQALAVVRDARQAAAAVEELTEQRHRLEAALADAAGATEAASTEVAERRAHHARLVQVLDDSASALRAGLGSDEEDAARLPALLEDRLARLTSLLRLVEAAEDAAARSASAAEAEHEARLEATDAAAAAGFESPDAARAALLDDRARSELETRRRERESAETLVAAVLAEPELAVLDDTEALPHDHEDLQRAESAAHEARQAHARCVAALEQAQDRVAALRAQADQLAGALATWAPAESEAATVGRLAHLVRGAGDNRLRMRLSSYVLATRLDQVLDAANARLSHMRDTRYLLRRTDRGRRANAQAGLDLEVLDEWTGEVRPPSSLSGGECFVVSLALALGLADVIGEESGGIEVDTLFIDEGFGTLDAETLDQVMDRIDELRSGGRAVGVVSHVSELRNRIPTQVHVAPSRTGSSIAIARGDA